MKLTRKDKNGIVFYESPLLRDLGIPHAFSTRIGGCSPAPFDALNLGNPSGTEVQDDRTRILRNYAMLEEAGGCSRRERCWVHQVHGARVVEVSANAPHENGEKADALFTCDASRVLSVRTADCVPVLLASRDGAFVAAIHSGWRGVVAGVVPAAVRKLCEKSSFTPEDFVAAIGPSIGKDAFEVGAEVVAQFSAAFGSTAPISVRGDGKGQVDLRECIRAQLMNCSVKEIDTNESCTHRDRDEFFSHRRENRVTGRMAALISPRG